MTRELRVALILFATVLAMGAALEFGGTPFFDPWLSRLAAEARTRSGFWLFLSHLGQGQIVAVIALISAGLLWLRQRGRDALILIAIVGAEMGTNPLLKMLFARVRPDLYPHLDPVFDLSYPSGHSAQNACLYVSLALLVHSRIAFAGVPLAILIGLSRVVLGVHWPTDVLGGWIEGAAFALLGAHFSKRTLATRSDT